MEYIPGSVTGTHVVITGPLTGTVQLEDGSIVDVTANEIEVDSPEKAAEVAHLVSLRYQDEGHPNLRELDDDPESETYGQLVQRPFVYVTPEEMAQLDQPSEDANLDADLTEKG